MRLNRTWFLNGRVAGHPGGRTDYCRHGDDLVCLDYSGQRTSVQLSALNLGMQGLLDVMERDIRRAGYFANASLNLSRDANGIRHVPTDRTAMVSPDGQCRQQHNHMAGHATHLGRRTAL